MLLSIPPKLLRLLKFSGNLLPLSGLSATQMVAQLIYPHLVVVFLGTTTLHFFFALLRTHVMGVLFMLSFLVLSEQLSWLINIIRATYWLECDSSLVINTINKKSLVPWRLRNRWENCMRITSSMNFLATHVFREGNSYVDTLANLGLFLHHHMVWLTAPNCITTSIAKK